MTEYRIHTPQNILYIIISTKNIYGYFYNFYFYIIYSYYNVFTFVSTDRCISPYSVRMRKNTDQKNSECGHFWRSAKLNGNYNIVHPFHPATLTMDNIFETNLRFYLKQDATSKVFITFLLACTTFSVLQGKLKSRSQPTQRHRKDVVRTSYFRSQRRLRLVWYGSRDNLFLRRRQDIFQEAS